MAYISFSIVIELNKKKEASIPGKVILSRCITILDGTFKYIVSINLNIPLVKEIIMSINENEMHAMYCKYGLDCIVFIIVC